MVIKLVLEWWASKLGIIKTIIERNWMLWSIWCLIIVLRYGGSDIRVMLVEVVMKNTCVKGCDSRSMHVWWTALWWSWSIILFIDCLPYEWLSGTSDGLFLQIYPPRSMPVVLCFQWLVDFCNKYVSSLWLMLSSWIIHNLTLTSLLASSVPCIARSHIESWCKLRWCIQTPWYATLFHT